MTLRHLRNELSVAGSFKCADGWPIFGWVDPDFRCRPQWQCSSLCQGKNPRQKSSRLERALGEGVVVISEVGCASLRSSQGGLPKRQSQVRRLLQKLSEVPAGTGHTVAYCKLAQPEAARYGARQSSRPPGS